MVSKQKQLCRKCNVEMIVINHQKTMVEEDTDDMTDGQMADYLAAQESGDYGNWEVEIYTFQCPKCKKTLQVQVN